MSVLFHQEQTVSISNPQLGSMDGSPCFGAMGRTIKPHLSIGVEPIDSWYRPRRHGPLPEFFSDVLEGARVLQGRGSPLGYS
ncbi:hypothetical protein I7I48_09978 [Histoplasma ohiense]|nr:hypothetical protein I7I48_09978 [Histoplasma ohiense (nom. inval.)]